MKLISHDESDLSRETAAEYMQLGVLPDGRLCGIHRLMFHWTMHVDVSESGYSERYCFQLECLAFLALVQWDGQGDPLYWHKHLPSERRRDNDTGRIYTDEEWNARHAHHQSASG